MSFYGTSGIILKFLPVQSTFLSVWSWRVCGVRGRGFRTRARQSDSGALCEPETWLQRSLRSRQLCWWIFRDSSRVFIPFFLWSSLWKKTPRPDSLLMLSALISNIFFFFFSEITGVPLKRIQYLVQMIVSAKGAYIKAFFLNKEWKLTCYVWYHHD